MASMRLLMKVVLQRRSTALLGEDGRLPTAGQDSVRLWAGM